MPRRIDGDWFDGFVPDNVRIEDGAYLETSQCFEAFRSARPEALVVSRGAALYTGTMLDVGSRGRVRIGSCAMLTTCLLVCDELIEIGDYCLFSWNVVIMDTYRTALDPASRRAALRRAGHDPHRRLAGDAPARPVRIGPNVWIGFDSCILPGVTIGGGSIVGARSVIAADVPPCTIVAGNPAREVRRLTPQERTDA